MAKAKEGSPKAPTDWEAIERASGEFRFYVYELADPRDGSVFYVGKGTGRRAREHIGCAERGHAGARHDRIRSIMSGGRDIDIRIVASGMTELDALQAEEERIASYPEGQLCNVYARGCRSGMRTTPPYRMARTFAFLARDLVAPRPGRYADGDIRYAIAARQHFDVMRLCTLAERIIGRAALVSAERQVIADYGVL